MAKRFKKNENYQLGNGNLLLTTYSGDANHSDITVKLNNIQIVNGENEINNFDLGRTDELHNSILSVYAKISKTNPGNHVSFTVKLNDSIVSEEYPYHSIEPIERIVKYEIKINLI